MKIERATIELVKACPDCGEVEVVAEVPGERMTMDDGTVTWLVPLASAEVGFN